MSTDYNRFEVAKTMLLPQVMRGTLHNKERSELINSIFNHYGTSSFASFPASIRTKLKEIEKIHASCDDFVYVGIEVELENFREYHDVTEAEKWDYNIYWLDKEDGSLRNDGREFISRFGMLREHTHEALPALEKYVTTVTNNRIEANARTGLHVHIDASQLTAYRFANLLFIYSIFEPMIFHVSGGRNENIFCVPWETNRQTLGQVVSHLVNPHNHRSWRWRNYSKYCGLNLASMATFGTIEFRMHKGTYKAEEIQKWVNFLSNLYLYAKRTDFIENLNRFRTRRDDYKYWDVFAEIFMPYSKEIEELQICKREELIARCKYATINFFKHFVDMSKMPDSEVIPNKLAISRFDPDEEWHRELEAERERDWGDPPDPPVRLDLNRIEPVARVVLEPVNNVMDAIRNRPLEEVANIFRYEWPAAPQPAPDPVVQNERLANRLAQERVRWDAQLERWLEMRERDADERGQP